MKFTRIQSLPHRKHTASQLYIYKKNRLMLSYETHTYTVWAENEALKQAILCLKELISLEDKGYNCPCA
jgi:hypothetical protein